MKMLFVVVFVVVAVFDSLYHAGTSDTVLLGIFFFVCLLEPFFRRSRLCRDEDVIRCYLCCCCCVR